MRVLVYLLLFNGLAGSAQAQRLTTNENTISQRHSYLKFSVVPFILISLYKKEAVWLILHYESQFKDESKFTYNIVLDYHNFTFTSSINGVPLSKIPDNIDFYIRPQIRFYTGEMAYKGYFIGVFPLYLYRDLPSVPLKGHYYGAGFITGYQFFVRKKIPLEFNFLITEQTGMVSKLDLQGQSIRARHSYAFAFFELNLGLPIKRSR